MMLELILCLTRNTLTSSASSAKRSNIDMEVTLLEFCSLLTASAELCDDVNELNIVTEWEHAKCGLWWRYNLNRVTEWEQAIKNEDCDDDIIMLYSRLNFGKPFSTPHSFTSGTIQRLANIYIYIYIYHFITLCIIIENTFILLI